MVPSAAHDIQLKTPAELIGSPLNPTVLYTEMGLKTTVPVHNRTDKDGFD